MMKTKILKLTLLLLLLSSCQLQDKITKIEYQIDSLEQAWDQRLRISEIRIDSLQQAQLQELKTNSCNYCQRPIMPPGRICMFCKEYGNPKRRENEKTNDSKPRR